LATRILSLSSFAAAQSAQQSSSSSFIHIHYYRNLTLSYARTNCIENRNPKVTMKILSSSIFALTVVSSITAFAPAMPSSYSSTTKVFGAGNTDPVDPTMNGIDDNLGYDAFDPTSGDSPAVSRNNHGGVWVKQRARPRRNRKSAGVRAMVRENIVTPANFIYPLFIHDEDHNTEISSMPGCFRHCAESMMKEVGEALDLGVKAFVLFPKVDDKLKTNLACEAYNPQGIVHRSIRMIKAKYPDAIVCTDVALDPYSDQGHDGVVENGVILNDITVNQLCKQAVSQARAGADIVAPSDMQVSS
jgi:porphobilinogen synthase